MSTLIVPVALIDKVLPLTNSDNLEIAHVLGFQVVIPKETFHEGDKVLYVPPDSVLPVALSDQWGVTKYLSNGRVRAVRLRGEPSFGFVQPYSGSAQVGDNLAEEYQIEKYTPPLRASQGDAMADNALFPRYTDIEDLRHYPTVINTDELVVVTEKIHGANCRVAWVNGELLAGSHNQQRKAPAEGEKNLYWSPHSLESVKKLFAVLNVEHRQIVLYGEIYGAGIQKGFSYGNSRDEIGFRAFDLLLDGKYVDWQTFKELTEAAGIATVPYLGIFPYRFDKIAELGEGQSALGGNIREGVVLKPLHEQFDFKLGRVVLKYKSDAFLTGKGAEQEVADV